MQELHSISFPCRVNGNSIGLSHMTEQEAARGGTAQRGDGSRRPRKVTSHRSPVTSQQPRGASRAVSPICIIRAARFSKHTQLPCLHGERRSNCSIKDLRMSPSFLRRLPFALQIARSCNLIRAPSARQQYTRSLVIFASWQHYFSSI